MAGPVPAISIIWAWPCQTNRDARVKPAHDGGRAEAPMQPQKIGVIGGGLMGHGIAYLLAAAGHEVAVFEPAADIRASLSPRLHAIAHLLEDDPALIERIEAHDSLASAVKDTQFVFEAAPEKLTLKQQIFGELATLTAADTILASNSSAIPTTEIAGFLKHRERVVGTHFWNPPHLVPLVEVIQNEWTSPDVVERTIVLLRDSGKRPVHVKKDIPGFIGNRLQHALKREAIALVAAGVCDAETLDTVVREGFGARLSVLGPLEQSDLVGLDLTLDISNVLVEHLDRTAGPHPFLIEKVKAGKLGMRTGEGFRRWTTGEAEAVRERLRRFLAETAKRHKQHG
jgi:3-hydroxybutyryl-CoA dehydrogenase